MTQAIPDTPILGEAPELQSLLRSAQLVAATDVTVLVLGESGTGKELLARLLHRRSRRHAGPFIAINCAALPETLAESELFGHRKGAFTGALADKPGRVQVAAGGTLFLDEIGELPLSVQAKLLRLLEAGECQPVGAAHPERVDTRIVAATHRDLHTLVKEGRFREDLYYRLNIVPLELPPLRCRGGDVALLLHSLTLDAAGRHGLQPPRYLPATLRVINSYGWPGNVRELRNFSERMVILFTGREVAPENLPFELRGATRPSDPFRLPDEGLSLDDLERDMIRQALEKTHGNRSRAARLLGLTRDTLLYRLKKYALA
jgi:DNA-binding NtrC family response regulator